MKKIGFEIQEKVEPNCFAVANVYVQLYNINVATGYKSFLVKKKLYFLSDFELSCTAEGLVRFIFIMKQLILFLLLRVCYKAKLRLCAKF